MPKTPDFFPYGQGARVVAEPKPAPARRSNRSPAAQLTKRMYAAARSSRLTSDWQTSNSSADAELVSSLTALRARSRALVRDSSYAKCAQTLVCNNVIGWNGIGLQAGVKTNEGAQFDRVNTELEDVFAEWSDASSCHIGGRLHFAHLERAMMAQVFEAGEVFIRLHYVPMGQSKIPLTLELIEAERLADDFAQPGPAAPGNQIRMGVECDKYFRPIAYWIREQHPGEVRWSYTGSTRYERVPAADIIHMARVDRWPQTRGEPWMHTVAKRLNDMDGYADAEIVRARAQAVRIGIIETSEDAEDLGEEQEDGSFEAEYEPGGVYKLNPGEVWHDNAPTAPNPQLDPFMRYMLREVAAGIGTSYESLSRDYSQSNYSSSRMGVLDDRDMWRFYQWWFVRDFRVRLHRVWVQQAALGGAFKTFSIDAYAANPRRYDAASYKPRGWTWIDPTKEVEAYEKAVAAGFTTRSDVIAQTAGGQDVADIDETRERELKQEKAKGLVFTTSQEFYMAANAKSAPPAEPKPAGKSGEADGEPDDDETATAGKSRVLAFGGKSK